MTARVAYVPRRVYWRAPSGRLHQHRACSGGPGPRLMKRCVRLAFTRAEALQAYRAGTLCRCAIPSR